MEIHERIMSLRKSKRISQAELADSISMSTQNYWKIEKGHTELTITRLTQIAKVLQVPLIELITGEPQKANNSNEVEELKKEIAQLYDWIKDKEEIIKYLRRGFK